jgi:hypothetical protein
MQHGREMSGRDSSANHGVDVRINLRRMDKVKI